MKELRKAFRVVVGKPGEKRPIERPKLLKNNIEMDLNRMDSSASGYVLVARSF
jgi:hypothetical protein